MILFPSANAAFFIYKEDVNNMEDLTDDFLPRQPCTYCAVFDLSLNNKHKCQCRWCMVKSAMVVLRRFCSNDMQPKKGQARANDDAVTGARSASR